MDVNTFFTPNAGMPAIAAGQMPSAGVSLTPEQLAAILRATPIPSQPPTQAVNNGGGEIKAFGGSGGAGSTLEQNVHRADSEIEAAGVPDSASGGGGLPNMPPGKPGSEAYNKWLLQQGMRERAPGAHWLDQAGRGAQLLSGYYQMHKDDKAAAQRQQAIAQQVSGAPTHSDTPPAAQHQFSLNTQASSGGSANGGFISKLMGW